MNKLITPYNIILLNAILIIVNCITYSIVTTNIIIVTIVFQIIAIISMTIYILMDSEWYKERLKRKILKEFEKTIDKE